MPEESVVTLAALAVGAKKTVTMGGEKVLLVRTGDVDGVPQVFAVEAECPHAGAPLEKGAVCAGRIVCPWHMGTFELATGALVEPPALRGLKRYAVRVDDGQVTVGEELAAEKVAAAGETKHFVFAGGGAATAAAVCHLRQSGFVGGLTVIEPVRDEPVDRTVLTKAALSGQKKVEKTPLFTFEEMARLKLDRVTGRVASIDAGGKSVTTDAGRMVCFDGLMLATGGVPRRLEVPGAVFEHVFTIRHTADVAAMLPMLGAGVQVVVAGDSFIAFEAASALRERGLEVTVVARSLRPFAKKFGEEIAAAIVGLHREKGVTVLTGDEVVSIGPESVMLKSGTPLMASVVVMAVGVTPVTEYAASVAKAEDGGFAVGRDLKLADGVYAAGDVASVDGVRIEHWRLAQQHGRVVAEAMLAGGAPEFAGVPFFWTFHFGKRMGYLGHAEEWEAVEVVGDVAAMTFLALYVQGGRVAAAMGCGMDTALAALAEPMRGVVTVEQAREIVEGVAG